MIGRFLSCTRGAAAAEMAMITPLAMLLLFSSIEVGHYYYQRHQVVKALRDGARFAARQSFDEVNCRNGSGSISSAVVTSVQNLTLTGQIASGGSPRIGNWTSSDISVTVTCPSGAESTTGIFRSAEPAPQVNVTTNFGYNSLFNGLGVITDSARLGGVQQAVVMGI